MDETYSAYTIAQNRHKDEYDFHSRDTIEYNGEYYTKSQLTEMYLGMKTKMETTITKMEADKAKERSKAIDDIHKQIYIENIHTAMKIINIVAIVFAPLALVDLLVISYELVCTDKKFDFSTFVSIALDIFALVPFVGAVFSLGGRAGNVARGSISTIVSDGSNAIIQGADSIKGVLPYVSLGGYLQDVNVFIKNVAALKGATRAVAVGNMVVQTAGQVGAIKGAYDASQFNDVEYSEEEHGKFKNIKKYEPFTTNQLGEDFVLIVKN